LLRHRIKRQPDASLIELQEHLATTAGVTVSLPTIHRSLRDSGLTRKKRA
jgi:hypothetical protein